MIGGPGRRPVPLARLPDPGPGGQARSTPRLHEAPVTANERIGSEYWRLTLDAPEIASSTTPGQFAMLTVAPTGEPAPVLPRPMAIYARDLDAGTVDFVYRVVGEGTRRLTAWRRGDAMVAVGPLGQGFVVPEGARRIVLLGRGIGTCSLTVLAADAAAAGVAVVAITSARNRDLLLADAYRNAGVERVICVMDEDGSSRPDAVAAALEGVCARGVDEFFVCGSGRLLALAADLADAGGVGVQVSLEAHMACGLGYCHGCAAGRPGLPRETHLVCADGPVFRYAESGHPNVGRGDPVPAMAS